MPFLILLAGGLYYFFFFNKDPVSLSSQQQELVNKFGQPTTFILVFGEELIDDEFKRVRYEIWNYNQYGRRFRFIDGEFKAVEDIRPIKEAQYPTLRPSMFEEGITLEDIKKVVKIEPNMMTELDPELIPNAKGYNFAGQLAVGVHEGKVVFIQTYPVIGEIELKAENL